MYAKLFSKILDSSIWLEADATRIVWFTFLASMDEDGFCAFASVPNLAHRARVTLEAATAAVAILEGPDPHSSDPEHEGRRVERVSGGWMVLNSGKFRELVRRSDAREANRRRVRRHRESKRPPAPAPASSSAPAVTEHYGALPVMQSEAYTDTEREVQADPVLAAPQSATAPRPTATTAGTAQKGAEEGTGCKSAGPPIGEPGRPGGRGAAFSGSSGSGLIRSPLDWDRARQRCAYVGARLEVPHKLYRDLFRESGAAGEGLLGWFAEVDAELEASGEPIAPDVFAWLTKRWKSWIGSRREALELEAFRKAVQS